ncbi:MAG: 2-methylcitrate dehydratase, partial [Boseongicola sp.]
IGNSVQVFFTDGTWGEKISVDYPLGHRRRREEGIPVLVEKYHRNLTRRFAPQHVEKIIDVTLDRSRLSTMTVDSFTNLFVE